MTCRGASGLSTTPFTTCRAADVAFVKRSRLSPTSPMTTGCTGVGWHECHFRRMRSSRRRVRNACWGRGPGALRTRDPLHMAPASVEEQQGVSRLLVSQRWRHACRSTPPAPVCVATVAGPATTPRSCSRADLAVCSGPAGRRARRRCARRARGAAVGAQALGVGEGERRAGHRGSARCTGWSTSANIGFWVRAARIALDELGECLVGAPRDAVVVERVSQHLGKRPCEHPRLAASRPAPRAPRSGRPRRRGRRP